jgi:Flp pilus assembly protein TadG
VRRHDVGEEVNRRRGDSRGQSLVEFALVLPILLVMFMGIFDFGRAIFAFNSVSNAAREGMRVAIVNQNPTVITSKAKAAMTGLPPDGTSVTFTNCGTLKIGCLASVKVTYGWQALTPIIGNLVGPKTIESTTTMPVERVYTSSP